MANSKFLLPLLLSVAMVVGVLLGTVLNFPNSPLSVDGGNLRHQKLKQLINYIDYDYVDEVNTDSLLDLTIQDLLHRLDPHSSYISQAEVSQAKENLQGNFEGIGIEFTTVRDSLTVLRVIEDGPSEKAGLMAGDRIVIVNTDTIAGLEMSNAQYIGLLKGPAGSEVNVEVFRPYLSSRESIVITRGRIPIPSVEITQMLSENVGIIKVNRFSETTYDEFFVALKTLKRQGMTKLILDLRDNPGGLLFTANKIADEFLEKDQLIVYTIDRSGKKDHTYASNSGGFKKGELIVLINENSASASEIVAGALQDNDRAIIVGRRSFGKGLVQEEMELMDGSRVRLTTSRYYTPTGRSIQKPYGSTIEEYHQDANDRYTNGEMFEKDSIKVNENEKFVTPAGKIVYGGGGIVPDVFVAVDTSSLGMIYQFFGLGRMDGFAFTLVDENRKDFININKQDFLDNYKVDDKIMADFLQSLGVEGHEKFIKPETKDFLRVRLKALIGRNLFGSEAYFAVMNEVDVMVEKSIEIFSK